jgi:hypothetical protein
MVELQLFFTLSDTYVRGQCDLMRTTFQNFSLYLADEYPSYLRFEFDEASVINNNFTRPHFEAGSELLDCHLLHEGQTCFPINREEELSAIRSREIFLDGPRYEILSGQSRKGNLSQLHPNSTLTCLN